MRLTAELEPMRTRTEKELARRFEQLRPEEGHVHAHDVRITSLFEALVRGGTTILGVLKEMDTDGNGSVTYGEFRSAVKRLHLEGDLLTACLSHLAPLAYTLPTPHIQCTATRTPHILHLSWKV